ncbi:MAG TPA: hypothetical protein VI114_03055 [Chthoniobacterales bacterium]
MGLRTGRFSAKFRDRLPLSARGARKVSRDGLPTVDCKVRIFLTQGFHFLPRFQKFVCYIRPSMAIQKKNAFSRRLPDLVTEELVTVLSQKKSFEFKQLFEIVHENLRQRNAASGGEEMLRLRAYEKLQNLVARGVVKKTGKIYKGDSSALAAMTAANTAQAAAVAAAKS